MRAALLTSYLATVREFDWEKNNCCHFVFGWVAVLTGANPMHSQPATPGPLAARRLAQRWGGLPGALAAHLGPAVAPACAQVGDVVLCGNSAGICTGRLAAVLSDVGLQYTPMLEATSAWKVK